MKASIDITLPEKGGTVTISLTSVDKKYTFTETDYPNWFAGSVDDNNNLGVTNVKGFKSSTLTYTYTSDKAAKICFSTATDRFKADWGNISLSISGSVEKFAISGGATNEWNKYIVGLTINSEGGILNDVALAQNHAETEYLPNLTTLVISDNKLVNVPVKTGKMTNYSMGKVSTSGLSLTDKANGFMLDAAKLFESSYKTFASISSTALSIDKLYKGGKDCTNDVESTKVNSVYHFVGNDGIYVYGDDYTADIKITDAKYGDKGIILSGVKLNITKAQFALNKESDGSKVSFTVSPDKDTYEQGEVITVTPVVQEGYAFAGFDVEGLEKADNYEDGNRYIYKVIGNGDIKIKVKSQSANAKVSISTNATEENGTVTVWYNGAQVNNGDQIPCGAEIEIRAEAKNESFTIDDVMFDGNSIKGKNTVTNDPMRFVAKVEVPNVKDGGEVKIEVTFKGNAKELTIVRDDDVWTKFELTDNSEKNYAANSEKHPQIPVGTELTLTMQVNEGKLGSDKKPVKISVQMNGTEYKVEELSNGLFVVKGLKMPNANSQIIVKLGKYEELKDLIELKETSFVYDGTAKKVEVVAKSGKFVEPEVLSSITIEYAQKTSDTYTKKGTPFVEVGEHYVLLSRAADDNYAKLEEHPLSYTITATDLYITKQPTVSVKDGEYVFTGGKVGYKRGNDFVDVEDMDAIGSFAVWNGSTSTTEVTDKDATTVRVVFLVKEDNNTFNSVIGDGKSVVVAVDGADVKSLPVYRYIADDNLSSSLIIKNGGSPLEDGKNVPVGTKVTFEIQNEDPYGDYAVYLVDNKGAKIKNDNTNYYTSGFEVGSVDVDAYYFELVSEAKRTNLSLTIPTIDDITYDGTEHPYDLTKLVWKDQKDGSVLKDDNTTNLTSENYFVISYKEKKTGKMVAVPVNAGDYEITISRGASRLYNEMAPVTGTMHIKQAKLSEEEIKANIPAPTATRISKGQKLSMSNLIGTPNILGTYKWAEEDKPINETGKYRVDFEPADGNYSTVEDLAMVEVVVTDKAIVTYSVPDGLGTITVTDKAGNTYASGDEIADGVQLTVTATPKDANKVVLESLKIGNRTYTTSPQSFTFGTSTVEITATFSAKVAPGNFRVSIPDANDIRGAIISNGGEHVVAQGGSLSFTVSTLAADADKVRVTAGGRTLSRGTNGRYTLSNVQANTTVSVSLSNPTEIEVDVPRTYLNKKDYHIGSVEIESDDDEFYYGDVITLIAFPESGVSFDKWSDGNKEQIRELTLTEDVALKAVFSGTPTGIEDIESARISTGHGFIQIKNVANADLTIVSIAGRIQTQQRISGDVQIRVPQGVYVVVLESDGNVQRTKVIVR